MSVTRRALRPVWDRAFDATNPDDRLGPSTCPPSATSPAFGSSGQHIATGGMATMSSAQQRPEVAQGAELVRRRIGGMIHYSRWFVLRTGQVHWGRVHPDYHGKRWLATACGWATPYEGLLMETTDSPPTCKRCAAMRSEHNG